MADKDDSKVAAGGGISFSGMLAILFIGLKLTHYIAWSWWWVLAPLWIPLVVFFGVVGVLIIVYLAVALIAALMDR